MIRIFLAGLFFWFALLGLFSLPSLLVGLAVLCLLWFFVRPEVTPREEACFLVRLALTLPESYRQGLLLLLGPNYLERKRLSQFPLYDPWEIFVETFFQTLTPENLVTFSEIRKGLVVHDLEARE